MTAKTAETKILDNLKSAGNIAYGATEAAAGVMLLPISYGLTAAAIFDGTRRIYREAPAKVKALVPRAVQKLVSARQQPLGNKRDAMNAADAALGFGVMLAGGVFFLGFVVTSFIGAFFATAPSMLPLVLGAVLIAGGATSTVKRAFGLARDHADRPKKSKPAFLHQPLSRFWGRKAAPDFNARADVPTEKPPALAPTLKPPAP